MSNSIKLNISKTDLLDMRQYLKQKVQEIPSELPTLKISEHAEKNRIMPVGPRPGPLDLSFTPYLIEPMDNMSPFSYIQQEVILKGAQLGFTMLSECVVCYYIGYSPADILFISATEDLLERWASRRLEPALDSYDLRRHIYAQYTNEKTRRSGDKVLSKEYFGCRMDMASAQSAAKLRATDKRVLIRDEIDGAPGQLTTGEGNWLNVSYVRTNAWGDRRKVLDFSTPGPMETSLMWPAYLLGDQRKFMVPCPKCGKKQPLDGLSETGQAANHGIKSDTKAGKIENVYYLCQFCHEAIFNHEKTGMLAKGKYEPTSESYKKQYVSRYVNSLYSPVGMLSWREYFEEYEKAQSEPEGMRWFRNLYDGLPSKETGTRPKLDKIIQLRGGYRRGTVPDGVLYLTAGADVQRGADRFRDMNDSQLASEIDRMSKEGKDLITENVPRIEMEIMGSGALWQTWSIDYFTFFGKTDDPDGGAFAKLYDFINEGGFVFDKKGKSMSVETAFIDSGDGEFYDVVYSFCLGLKHIHPSKGFGSFTQKSKKNNYDGISERDVIKYKMSMTPDDQIVVNIATYYYKSLLYTNLNKSIANRTLETGDQRFICNFPNDYPDRYFKGLQAEERLTDKFDAGGRRNEPVDCRVYALCAADFWIDGMVRKLREAMKQRGATKEMQESITKKTIIERLEKENKPSPFAKPI